MNTKHCLMAAALMAWPAFGTTIISQLYNATGGTGALDNLLAVSWSETGSYTGVTISANISAPTESTTATGTAYLVDQLGAGTTLASNEIAGAGPIGVSVTGNPGLNGMTTIYSGLTLGPGTYYLVIDPTDTSLHWDLTTSAGIVTDTGVTQGPSEIANSAVSFPPASAFGSESNLLIYEVTGTAGTVGPGPSTPEPSTVAMLLTGLGALVCLRKWQSKTAARFS